MSTAPIISVSGLRGVVGESLTPDVALRYVAAFAAPLAGQRVVVTRDGRSSGPMVANSVRAALMAAGVDVIDADVAPTPTTGVLIRQYQAAGGIQISASHNPPPYNGLKLFGKDGRVLSAGPGAEVLERYRQQPPRWVTFEQLGSVTPCPDVVTEHVNKVLAIVDARQIRRARLRVLLDANHGAGSVVGLPLLEQLGCEVVACGATADGQFEHPPEPTAENLQSVGRHVQDAQAAVGLCQDPDADRLALIDHQGTYVGEEFTLAVCAKHVLSQTPGPVVTNCSTSRMTEDLARSFDVPFFRSRVGEANVCDVMLQQQAVFGGEGNGGPIDPRVGYVRDSFVGMALVLDAMAARNMTLRQLVDELPQYAICKSKVPLAADRLQDAWQLLQDHFADAQPDTLDGLRLDWPDRWLLVRASNTEPIVRSVAEAPSQRDAAALCAQAEEVLGKLQ